MSNTDEKAGASKDGGWQLSLDEIQRDLQAIGSALGPEHDAIPLIDHVIERLVCQDALVAAKTEELLRARNAALKAGFSGGDIAEIIESLSLAREETREAAARVCDDLAGKQFSMIGICVLEDEKHTRGARVAMGMECATAIRALALPHAAPQADITIIPSQEGLESAGAAPIQAHSKSEYKRLKAQGADVTAPSTTPRREE